MCSLIGLCSRIHICIYVYVCVLFIRIYFYLPVYRSIHPSIYSFDVRGLGLRFRIWASIDRGLRATCLEIEVLGLGGLHDHWSRIEERLQLKRQGPFALFWGWRALDFVRSVQTGFVSRVRPA